MRKGPCRSYRATKARLPDAEQLCFTRSKHPRAFCFSRFIVHPRKIKTRKEQEAGVVQRFADRLAGTLHRVAWMSHRSMWRSEGQGASLESWQQTGRGEKVVSFMLVMGGGIELLEKV